MDDVFKWVVALLIAWFLLRPFIRGIRSGLRGDTEADGDDFPLEVVGEASYQRNLIAVAGPRGEESAEVFVEASVSHEDSNPHDSKAVRVNIEGKTVGYLSRDNARRWRRTITQDRVVCPAVIRGGWKRGRDDVGHYGVWLQPPSTFK